jgi:peptide/nickel transport system substrate-binding protein
MASDAGLDALTSRRDLDTVRRDLLAAGYRGETVVVILPASLWRARMFGEVAVDLLRRVGMTVDAQVMDTASWARRLVSTKAPDQGGWNVFCTSMQGTDALSPATHTALRGNGDRGFAGWPTSPEIEALRDEWLDAPDVASQRCSDPGACVHRRAILSARNILSFDRVPVRSHRRAGRAGDLLERPAEWLNCQVVTWRDER